MRRAIATAYRDDIDANATKQLGSLIGIGNRASRRNLAIATHHIGELIFELGMQLIQKSIAITDDANPRHIYSNTNNLYEPTLNELRTCRESRATIHYRNGRVIMLICHRFV